MKTRAAAGGRAVVAGGWATMAGGKAAATGGCKGKVLRFGGEDGGEGCTRDIPVDLDVGATEEMDRTVGGGGPAVLATAAGELLARDFVGMARGKVAARRLDLGGPTAVDDLGSPVVVGAGERGVQAAVGGGHGGDGSLRLEVEEPNESMGDVVLVRNPTGYSTDASTSKVGLSPATREALQGSLPPGTMQRGPLPNGCLPHGGGRGGLPKGAWTVKKCWPITFIEERASFIATDGVIVRMDDTDAAAIVELRPERAQVSRVMG